MKSIDEMTGTERAAALLVALGPETAADILRHLDEKSVEKISLEIARIGSLSPESKEDLIGEFLLSLKKARNTLYAGEDSARELLEKTFGSDKAAHVFRRLAARDVEKQFDFTRDLEPELLIRLLENEMPQTIAVVFAYLPASKSAMILKSLPQDKAKDVALRVARLDAVSPEAVLEVALGLQRRYQKYLEAGRNGSSRGGVDSLMEILGHMSNDEERKLMRRLDGMIPSVVRYIRERTINFESVVNLSNQDVRILIDEINNDRLLAQALKGAGDDIRFRFMRNMSQNRATNVLADMESMGAIRLSAVEECRDEIVSVMRELYDNGVIHFRKAGDVFVD
jgi:flagellar motor switch protein FliG